MLRHDGQAEIRAYAHEPASIGEDIVVRVRIDDIVRARLAAAAFDPAHPPRFEGPPVPISIRELYAGCPDGTIINDAETRAAYPSCRLLHVDDPIILGTRRRADTPSIIAVTALAGLVGAGVCTFKCDAPYSYISGGVLGLGVLVLVGFGAALYIAAHPPT